MYQWCKAKYPMTKKNENKTMTLGATNCKCSISLKNPIRGNEKIKIIVPVTHSSVGREIKPVMIRSFPFNRNLSENSIVPPITVETPTRTRYAANKNKRNIICMIELQTALFKRFTAIKLGHLTPSLSQPKPNLVETTKAYAPDFAPYFMAGVVQSLFLYSDPKVNFRFYDFSSVNSRFPV
jgi:hypothetical protein